MADRPSTSAARVGRPRTRSVHQTPHAVGTKVGRPRSKSTHAREITDSSKNTKVEKTAKPTKQVKVVPPPEPRVIEIEYDNSDIEFPFQPERLPDLPPVEPDQLNPPNQPLNLHAGEENQQNQEANLVPNQPLDIPTEEPNQPHQPNQPPNLPIPPHPMANQQQLKWSYFKTEFAGKPEEDVEAHLLRTNDWMDTHNFPGDQKVRRFCLTLMGDARLWYETIRQVQMDWPAMQKHFRQQYSKFGNTREQYFHIWRFFQFDEITATIDSYIHKVKQVAALLDYGEPQILELFKNTLPSRLYYLLYQVDN